MASQPVGQIQSELVACGLEVPDQGLDRAAVGDGEIGPIGVGIYFVKRLTLGDVEVPGIVELEDIPAAVRSQAALYGLQVAVARFSRPAAVPELGEGVEGQDALAQRMQLEIGRLPVQAGRYKEQPVGIVAEPVQVFEHRAFDVGGNDESGGVFQTQEGIPQPGQVVRDAPAAGGQVVPLRVEPTEQMPAAQLQRLLQCIGHADISHSTPLAQPEAVIVDEIPAVVPNESTWERGVVEKHETASGWRNQLGKILVARRRAFSPTEIRRF